MAVGTASLTENCDGVCVPLSVIVSSFLLLVGIAFTITNQRRFRRTRDTSWLVLTIAAALISVLAAASLVVHVVRQS